VHSTVGVTVEAEAGRTVMVRAETTVVSSV